MGITQEPMEKQLNIAQVAISNALVDAEIQAILSEYGYTAEKINAGKALYEKAEELYQVQKKEYGEQFEASDNLKKAWKEAKKEYMKHLKIARIALKEKVSSFEGLSTNGTREKSFSGWLAQTKQFYGNALSSDDILSALGEFGITKEKLEAGEAKVLNVEALNLLQKKEGGEAQEATVKRDSAFDKMLEWIHDFIEISKVALEDSPQLIERLGIVER